MLSFASRLYCTLLRLYPPNFRDEYGAEMALLFNNKSKQILQDSGFWGLFMWGLNALADLFLNVVLEHIHQLSSHPMKTIRPLISLLLFLLTIPAVLFVLTIMTNLIFAPWDTALHRPELGTWQRTLNDFFETAPGIFTFSIPLVLANIYLVLRKRDLLTAAGINFAFAILFWVALLISFFVNNAVFPYPPVLYDPNFEGYHRAIIPASVFALMCVGWLRAVSRNVSFRHVAS